MEHDPRKEQGRKGKYERNTGTEHRMIGKHHFTMVIPIFSL
jgi:hypothetical protein